MLPRLAALSLLLLAAFCAVAALADDRTGFADKPAPTDFRGLPFGAAIADLPGLTPVPSQKDSYYRKDEEPTYGKAKIVSVAYYAREGKLFAVGMAVEGEANIFLVQDRLIQQFGQGSQRGDQYGWIWPSFSVVLKRVNKDKAAVYFTQERAGR
ncbi:MAG: hypothetical protein ACEB74_08895 [Desulfovibrio aminophilus]|jgi:hypothetical protein|uniref:hypothetical protein n=1 Tax=Desulfovibrio aminophilus TaxID=81425 RepID=UPI0039EA9E9D